VSDHRVKISVKSDHHALQNLSSNPTDKVTEFDSSVFQHSFDDISVICWAIWMQNSVLERLLVLDYMTEIRMWNFKNFMGKLGSEVEIC
jgi:hypothetical protein